MRARPARRRDAATAPLAADEEGSARRHLDATVSAGIVILAGNGHCHSTGIVGRMRRRGVKRAISVRPLVDKGDGEVAALLARPENDFLFVMTP